jgi:hypothetical protein
MGMFDSYEPSTQVNCLRCGNNLARWQGKDGPKELLLWKQGHAAPVGFLLVDDDQIIEFGSSEDADECGLPTTFGLYTVCQQCNGFIEALGKCNDGVWDSTTNAHVSE